jgi:hypothetical protein
VLVLLTVQLLPPLACGALLEQVVKRFESRKGCAPSTSAHYFSTTPHVWFMLHDVAVSKLAVFQVYPSMPLRQSLIK